MCRLLRQQWCHVSHESQILPHCTAIKYSYSTNIEVQSRSTAGLDPLICTDRSIAKVYTFYLGSAISFNNLAAQPADSYSESREVIRHTVHLAGPLRCDIICPLDRTA